MPSQEDNGGKKVQTARVQQQGDEHGKRTAKTGVIAAIIGGIAGVLGALATGVATWQSSRVAASASEDVQEGTLVIEAVRVCDEEQARNNLRALSEMGFVEHHKGKILQLILDGGLKKVIPPGSCPHANEPAPASPPAKP